MAKRRPPWVYKIARERIETLFNFSREMVLRGEYDLSRRYILLARRISMKYNVRIPSKLKRMFCKKCHIFLYPGITSQVRINRGKVTITCLLCGNIRRYLFIKEKKSKRRSQKNVR